MRVVPAVSHPAKAPTAWTEGEVEHPWTSPTSVVRCQSPARGRAAPSRLSCGVAALSRLQADATAEEKTPRKSGAAAVSGWRLRPTARRGAIAPAPSGGGVDGVEVARDGITAAIPPWPAACGLAGARTRDTAPCVSRSTGACAPSHSAVAGGGGRAMKRNYDARVRSPRRGGVAIIGQLLRGWGPRHLSRRADCAPTPGSTRQGAAAPALVTAVHWSRLLLCTGGDSAA